MDVTVGLEISERVRALHHGVLSAAPAVSAERALLVTRYFRDRANRGKPMIVRKAEALAAILRGKQVRIRDGELLVGCFTPHRVGGELFPELHGIAVMEDLLRFPHRKVNPFTVAPQDGRALVREVLPFWLPRFLGLRALPFPSSLRLVAQQLSAKYYLINELGGISHFVPDYEGLLSRGTDGFRDEIAQRLREVPAGSPASHFLAAARIVCDGLDAFADGYRDEALRLARTEPDPSRRRELERIAEVCGRVPRRPASSVQEALQSMLFAQIALNLESLDNSVCPGRLDQLLQPYYDADRAAGRLDTAGAFELLGCFAVKLCEIVPVFSARMTRFHGGLFQGQVVVAGGTDRAGADATNELTYLLLELMDRLRTRQPNYHARLHRDSPAALRARAAATLADGSVSPALYNDDVIVPLLRSRGVDVEDARDYCGVGCVEPVAVGRSFFSTDAALVNVGLCLELALSDGRRFGGRRRVGAATGPIDGCRDIEDLITRFRRQLDVQVARLLRDLGAVERANARLHPTPLTSLLLIGCVESATDASAGGARYNGSGIQGVGVVDVADSLTAIDTVVFADRRASLAEVVQACRDGFRGHEALRARLLAAPKFGNDDPRADAMLARVMAEFAAALAGRQNSRGGAYTAGFYSVTAHQAFGEVVGALPSGRQAGEAFASGLSPCSGTTRSGPTAALRSYASLPFDRALNGVNFNLQLPPWTGGVDGAPLLDSLIGGAFAQGCMQLQVNVLDPAVLREARDNPGRHPGLLVRVSGYSAYFDDLSPAMQDEIIRRFADAGC